MTTKYALSWAAGRYESWYQDAPRATETVLKIIGKDAQFAIHSLANGDDSWEKIKALRKLYRRLWSAHNPYTKTKQQYSTFVEYNVIALWEQTQKEPARPLTRSVSGFILEKHTAIPEAADFRRLRQLELPF